MGGGPSTVQTRQTPIIPKQLGLKSGFGGDILSGLEKVLFPGGQLQGYNPALNQQIAALTPAQQQALGSIEGMGSQVQPGLQGAQQANQLLTDPNMLYASSNPYLQKNVENMNAQIADAYQFGIAPSEMSQAVMSGAFGGSTDALQRLQNQYSFAQSLGSTDLEAYQQNYNTMLNQMQQASQAAPGIAQAQYLPAEMQLQAGGQQQQQQQNVLSANTANALQQQNFPYQILQQGMGIMSPLYNAFTGNMSISPNTMGK